VTGMEEPSIHLTPKSAPAGAGALGEGMVIDGSRAGARAPPGNTPLTPGVPVPPDPPLP
jgi:hypothetical protein